MEVFIEFDNADKVDDLQALLGAKGWRLERGAVRFIASHPEVKDQSTARARLHQLGLLTSRRLRIEFGAGN